VRRLGLAACFVAAVPSLALAQAAPGVCPAALEASETVRAPEGWTVHRNPLPRRLQAATFFDGPPQEMAALRYDEETETGSELVAVWRFAASSRRIWIRCSYEGSRTALERALPDGVRQCRVAYDRQSSDAAGLPTIKRIECR
jgi:hypothetical protein